MKYVFTIRFLLALPALIAAVVAIVIYETISGIKFTVDDAKTY